MTNKYLTRLALPLLLLSAANASGARIKSTLWDHPSVLIANQDYLKVQSVGSITAQDKRQNVEFFLCNLL